MGSHAFVGFGLIVLAGVVQGCTVLPMKYAIKWKWENIWLVFTGFALVIIPLVLVLSDVPQAWEVYREAKISSVWSVFLFGLGWGVGMTLAGIGYTMLGMGLGVSVVLGLTASIGSLLPLALLFPERLMSSSAFVLYAGVLVMLVGLVLSAKAGRFRQADRSEEEITPGADIKSFGKGDVRTGLLVCIGAGVLSSMVNLGLVYGDPIRQAALRHGASPAGSVNALWLPLMVSCFLVNFAYCAYLLTRNKTWPLYFNAGTGSHWFIGFLMGAFQMGSLSVYGSAANLLGEMGAIMGFPIFMSMTVLTANTAGLMTGEWRGSPRVAYGYGLVGMLALIASIVIIGLGNSAIR